jgi:hypothetical protein
MYYTSKRAGSGTLNLHLYIMIINSRTNELHGTERGTVLTPGSLLHYNID